MSRFTSLFQQPAPKVSVEPQKVKEVVPEKPTTPTAIPPKQPIISDTSPKNLKN